MRVNSIGVARQMHARCTHNAPAASMLHATSMQHVSTPSSETKAQSCMPTVRHSHRRSFAAAWRAACAIQAACMGHVRCSMHATCMQLHCCMFYGCCLFHTCSMHVYCMPHVPCVPHVCWMCCIGMLAVPSSLDGTASVFSATRVAFLSTCFRSSRLIALNYRNMDVACCMLYACVPHIARVLHVCCITWSCAPMASHRSLRMMSEVCVTSSTCAAYNIHTHATHTQHTRNTHATHTQHTCSTHAAHMQHTCNIHATHMQHTCNTHATHMQRTCNIHATNMQDVAYMWHACKHEAYALLATRMRRATCMRHAAATCDLHATCTQHACTML